MAQGEEREDRAQPGTQRLDKWLWFARVLKSRTQSAAAVSEGRVRINRVRVGKPSQLIKPGDVLTIALREKVLVLKMIDPGVRRGPPAEARTLYEDLTPPPAPSPQYQSQSHGQRDSGAGRPSKRDRRLIDRLRGSD